MKKYLCCCLLSSFLLLTACTKNTKGAGNTEEAGKTPVSEAALSIESAVEIINKCDNFTASGDFVIEIPENIDHLSNFELQYLSRQSNAEFHDDFIEMFSYIYPDRQMNDEYFMYYGENSYTDFDEDGNQIRDLNKVSDKLNEIVSDNEDVLYFLYDESWNSTAIGDKTPICMEFTSPMCNDLSRFNRGNAAKLATEQSESDTYPTLESFRPTLYFESVGSYPPDSTESFKLMDKEISINEAVDYFENYINNLPFPENPTLDMCVCKVDVLELTQDCYGYFFQTTKSYENIPFDSRLSGSYTGDANYEKYLSVLGEGLMIYTDEVEYVYGIYRSQTVGELESYDKMISFETAVKEISTALSASINFQVQKAEIVYCELAPDGMSLQPEDYIVQTAAAWKLTLYNENDKRTYVCFVDAENGGDFRYYTMNILAE